MMDSQSRDDEGELIFTEFEGQVLDRLDRIIALLTPAAQGMMITTGEPNGYYCPQCSQWVPYGSGHICQNWTVNST